MKFNDKYLGNSKMLAKGVSYAIQNHASTFAYTDQNRYLGMSGRQFLNITLTGFASGVINYGIGGIDTGSDGKFGKIVIRSAKFMAGSANYWTMDYSHNHYNIYGNYYGGATNYPYIGQKMTIGAIKNIFMYLTVGK